MGTNSNAAWISTGFCWYVMAYITHSKPPPFNHTLESWGSWLADFSMTASQCPARWECWISTYHLLEKLWETDHSKKNCSQDSQHHPSSGLPYRSSCRGWAGWVLYRVIKTLLSDCVRWQLVASPLLDACNAIEGSEGDYNLLEIIWLSGFA